MEAYLAIGSKLLLRVLSGFANDREALTRLLVVLCALTENPSILPIRGVETPLSDKDSIDGK